MRIAVVGLGYVGCVATAKLCAAGHEVTGVDLSPAKVALINVGKPTIIEPGLDAVLAAGKDKGLLRSVTSLAGIAADMDVFYLCVGTPSTPDGDLDLSAIFHVAGEIAAALPAGGKPKTLVLRSTVKPGTSAALRKVLEGKNVSVVMNPEFLREGTAMDDWDAPGIVVIGAFDDHGRDTVHRLHAHVSGKIFDVKPETAEAIKYVNNSWHALKVAFANEIGRVSHGFGIDHEELIEVFLADKKLNLSGYYLRPGMPYGGSCLPKDLGALARFAHDHRLPVPVLDAVALSNQAHVDHIVECVCCGGQTQVGVLGLSFKRGTDDLRHSPSIGIVRGLLARGVTPYIFDEHVRVAQLTGQNREQVVDLIPLLEKNMMPSLDALMAKVEVVVVAHDLKATIAELKARYVGKVFLEMFRFKV